MTRITKWIVRHAAWVAFITLVLSVFSAVLTIRLYSNLRLDMEELLPKSARSVVDLHTASDRLETVSNLGILVFSDHPAESKRFVVDLANQIRKIDPSLVSRVEYRIDEELNFFGKRRSLFIGTKDLEKIRDYVRDRIDYEKGLYNPLNIFRREETPEPRLDIRSLESKYSHRIAAFTKFKDGFYANKDRTVRVVLVFMSGKASGIASAKKMRSEIDQVIERLHPASYAPDLRIRYTGDVENLVEENASLVSDLELAAIVVGVLVTLVMILFYRNWPATIALTLSLLSGTLLTFAFAYYAVGYLNANSAFLGSIVMGNGINFGIILLARYLEERRAKKSLEGAIGIATSTTLGATSTASLAAALSYGALIMTTFRGFHQFGIIGLAGMVLCWLTAYLTLPAFLAIADRVRPVRDWSRSRSGYHAMTTGLASGIGKGSKWIIAVSVLITALCVAKVVHFNRDPHSKLMETNTDRLRDKKSMTEGSGYLARYLDEIFERYISPVVVLPANSDEAEKISKKLKERRDGEGSKSLIAGVYTMKDLIPKNQPKKIEVLREIKRMLKPRILNQLGPKEKRFVRDFLPPEVFRSFSEKDLPRQLKARFMEKDGSYGNIVLVEPIYDSQRIADETNTSAFVGAIRTVADSVRPGAPVVGQLPLTSDMFASVRRDGPRATAASLLAVSMLVVVLFRRWKTVGLVLGALITGVVWHIGAILQLGYTVNFLNFIVFPVTFGIGVDYAVNIVQRYRLDGRGSILNVIRHSGGAVILCSLTTIIGYGSLLLAGNQGFVSIGRLAVLGEVTCLVVAVLSLPAWIHFLDSRWAKKVKTTEPVGKVHELPKRKREEEKERKRRAA